MSTRSIDDGLLKQIAEFHQGHLIQWWSELGDAEQESLLTQLRETSFSDIHSMWREAAGKRQSDAGGASRADIATAPGHVVLQPSDVAGEQLWENAAADGEKLLSDGRVAIITVAGGQGTRLGFPHPKGMFPVGPVTDRTLFRIFAEQIQARQKRHRVSLLWMIMTSEATHCETVTYFEQQNYFGLKSDQVVFFQQASLPAVDAASGRILMSDRATLNRAPDGHGGLIAALQRNGLLKRLTESGVDYVFYHQVDNPTVIIGNPALIGFHHQHGSQVTTSVVKKISPTEKMGVLADVGGRTEIIEYSELTPEQAARQDESGQWVFWAGNTAVHVFSVSFLSQLTAVGQGLPLHVARKNVPYLGTSGRMVTPSDPASPNAIKFERFIFDAIPMAERTLIVEGHRDNEFNPVKNRDGADSPQTAAAALSRIAANWLKAAGVAVSDSDLVEISPLNALDAAELTARVRAGEEIRIHRRKL
ncbi:MAG: UTP--glucose-1-phosphate uridylyltransferase [Planctomyces sp.]